MHNVYRYWNTVADYHPCRLFFLITAVRLQVEQTSVGDHAFRYTSSDHVAGVQREYWSGRAWRRSWKTKPSPFDDTSYELYLAVYQAITGPEDRQESGHRRSDANCRRGFGTAPISRASAFQGGVYRCFPLDRGYRSKGASRAREASTSRSEVLLLLARAKHGICSLRSVRYKLQISSSTVQSCGCGCRVCGSGQEVRNEVVEVVRPSLPDVKGRVKIDQCATVKLDQLGVKRGEDGPERARASAQPARVVSVEDTKEETAATPPEVRPGFSRNQAEFFRGLGLPMCGVLLYNSSKLERPRPPQGKRIPHRSPAAEP